MLPTVKKYIRWPLTLAVSVVVLVFAVLGWLRFAPVSTAESWHYTEVQTGLDGIVSLARMPDDSIFATLSLKQHAGEKGLGKIIKLDIPAGRYTVLAEGLYKPDGLLPFDGGIVLTQEYSDKPVLLWKNGVTQPLFMLAKPESIASTLDGRWLIVEDSANGRLMEVDPHNNYQQKELAGSFSAAEGVCMDKNHRIFFVDNKIPDLMEYVGGKVVRIPARMRGAGFLRCANDGIWITEDVTNNGHLWFYDYKTFHEIASHLHSPQSVLEDGDGILVAEQGRARLLRFTRQ